MQFTLCGSGFLGQNSSYKQIGLGSHEVLDTLIITWPSGHIDKLYNLAGDQKLHILEGQSTNGEITVAEDVRIVERPVTTPTEDIITSPIILYPNPGDATISITTDLDISKIEIIDMHGHVIRSQSNITSQGVLSTEDLLVGIYLIRIWSEDHTCQLIKWVKGV